MEEGLTPLLDALCVITEIPLSPPFSKGETGSEVLLCGK